MAEQGYGSEGKPVSLDPFQTIVEVGWPSKRWVGVAYAFSSTQSSVIGCSPATHSGLPPQNYSAWYIPSAGIGCLVGNRTILNLGGDGPIVSGNLTGCPGSGVSGLFEEKTIAAWQAMYTFNDAKMGRNVSLEGLFLMVNAFAGTSGETRCYFGDVGGTYKQVLDTKSIYATFKIDLSGVVFTDDEENIWEPTRGEIEGGVSAGSMSVRIYLRKQSSGDEEED